MTQGHRPLSVHLTEALMDAGTWMSRGELQAAHECSAIAMDDALSDLVVAGAVDYRVNVGYRLAGSNVCRAAAQLMRREGTKAAVIAGPSSEGYRVGVAELRAAVGLVMYELALPLPAPNEDALQLHLEQVGGVIKFVNSRGRNDA